MVISMKATKPVEMIEGPKAAQRFTTAMKKILSIPRSEMIRREKEYKRQSDLNPRKRGPKPKPKSVSHGPAADV